MRNLLSIFSFRNRNPLTAIWLFLLLVMALETTFAFLPQNTLVRSFRITKELPDPAPDIQIMGDSVARDGILAERLQGFLPEGTRVHNFSIAAAGPEFPYFVLKRQIEAGKAPKTIIYAPSPHTFRSKRVALLVGGFCDWNEVVEVAGSRKEPFEVIYGVLCKVSYTLRHREQIGDIIKGNQPLFPKKSATPKVEEDPTVIAARRSYPKENLHQMYRNPFEVQPFNRYFYEKFLELAQQNNIQVYWVSMPVLSAVAESRKELDFDERYSKLLKEAQERFQVKILHSEFLVYEDGVFKDSTHLDKYGAERFTKVVGEKLQALPLGKVGDSAKVEP